MYNIAMSQLLGASRHPSGFQVSELADVKEQQLMTLYRSPATIRDLKQVFLYVASEATTTFLDPVFIFYPIEGPALQTNSPYYMPIGTQRKLDLGQVVNDLIDIRMEPDKYVIEINLAECVIEADSGNWQQIPDRVVRKSGMTETVEPTYRSSDSLAAPDSSTPPRKNIVTQLEQATKLSEPQTLYCRIKELSNNEPYNWSVTNSGQFSIDKSHQLLVRYGDISQQTLNVEFGHLIFEGRDDDYQERLDLVSNSVFQGRNTARKAFAMKQKRSRYQEFKYLDYNQEFFNVYGSDLVSDPVLRGNYPDFYRVSPDNIVQPATRPPFYHIVPGAPDTPYNLQGKPLLFNQQASRINMRFLIRIIHTF